MRVSPPRASAFSIGLLVASPLAAIWAICILLGDRLVPRGALPWVSNVGLCVAAFVAAGCGLGMARRPANDRRVWALVGLGCLAWGLGNTVWTFIELVRHVEPFPSAADVGYVGMPLLAAAGLISLSNLPRTAVGRFRALIDGLMIAGALFIVAWTLVIGDVAAAGAESLLGRVIGLFYPASDVIIVTLVLYAGLRHRQLGTKVPASLLLVGAGIIVFSLADMGFAYQTLNQTFSSSSPVNIGWFAGFVLIGLAALRQQPTGTVDDGRKDGHSLGHFIPHVAVLGALGVEIAVGRVDDLITASWAFILLSMMLRQVLVVRENLGLARHLEARVAARTADLASSERRFRALVQHSSDVVTVLDTNGVVTYQSDSIEPVFGYQPEDVLGRPIRAILDTDSAVALHQELDLVALESRGTRDSSFLLRNAAGDLRQVEMSITNLLDEPSVTGLVLNMRDVSDRRVLEEQLVHDAFHDPLTGLANRSLFADRLTHSLARATPRSEIAVLFVDLDDFKRVNDRLGHAAGDELLVEVACRLQRCVRPGDTVARFGGDEFAILLEGAGGDFGAVAVSERVCDAIAGSHTIAGQEILARASVGVALATDAETPEGLIQSADLAMYQAKAARLGGFALYDPQMHARLVDRVELEADLRTAVRNAELVLHYQPILELDSGKLVGFEALVRWQHPTRGLVPPLDFIPLAEEVGLIRPIGRWVLDEACRQAGEWHREHPGVGDLTMSVNLSPAELHDPELVHQVGRSLRDGGIRPDRLVLEITEGMLVERSAETVEVLQQLKLLGVRIAVDDFGTGYSSLSYLQRFPVDSLKIDRSFVDTLSAEGADPSFVNAIVQLGRSLNLTTVAEGIEDEDQLAALGLAGCDLGQGYHFSPPASAEIISRRLECWTASEG